MKNGPFSGKYEITKNIKTKQKQGPITIINVQQAVPVFKITFFISSEFQVIHSTLLHIFFLSDITLKTTY